MHRPMLQVSSHWHELVMWFKLATEGRLSVQEALFSGLDKAELCYTSSCAEGRLSVQEALFSGLGQG